MFARRGIHTFLAAVILTLAPGLPAQTSVPSSPYAPGVNLQPKFPNQPRPQLPASPPQNPFPQATGRPAQVPPQSIEVVEQEKVVNVDTALAALMKDLGNFSASGSMELWSTNRGKLDVNRFPFILVVKDGRIRTEIDLRHIPTGEENRDNLFATLREVGIHRIQTITLPQLTTVQVLFPHAKVFVTRGLSFEDIPGVIRFTRRRYGPAQIDSKVYEKFDVDLNYNTGERVRMEVWELPERPGEPARVKFHRDKSAVTVSFTAVRRGDVAEDFFKVPVDFEKFTDMDLMFQTVSARFTRAQAARTPGAPPTRSAPLVVRPNADGSFNRRAP